MAVHFAFTVTIFTELMRDNGGELTAMEMDGNGNYDVLGSSGLDNINI